MDGRHRPRDIAEKTFFFSLKAVECSVTFGKLLREQVDTFEVAWHENGHGYRGYFKRDGSTFVEECVLVTSIQAGEDEDHAEPVKSTKRFRDELLHMISPWMERDPNDFVSTHVLVKKYVFEAFGSTLYVNRTDDIVGEILSISLEWTKDNTTYKCIYAERGGLWFLIDSSYFKRFGSGVDDEATMHGEASMRLSFVREEIKKLE